MAECEKCDNSPAKARKYEAEADLARAEAREMNAQADLAEMNLEREKEKRDKEKAANERHRVYVFDSDVTASSVKKCMDQLTTWSRQHPGCEIEIQINSPGGSIFDGFALIDFIRDLREHDHHVTMVALGMAASMAGVLLQAADTRVIGANCFMLIHEGSLGAIGDFGDVEDRVQLMGQMHDRILALFEERATPINPKTTKQFIRRRWQRKDWWFPGHEALKLGFVDQVR
jgi:ATP-dependent Clp protease protease subunit